MSDTHASADEIAARAEAPAIDPLMVVADELRRLRREVKALANWWDLLPQETLGFPGGRVPWESVFAPGQWRLILAGASMSTHIEIIVQAFDDRLELSLRVDNMALWQRAIFYAPPPVTAFGLEEPA